MLISPNTAFKSRIGTMSPPNSSARCARYAIRTPKSQKKAPRTKTVDGASGRIRIGLVGLGESRDRSPVGPVLAGLRGLDIARSDVGRFMATRLHGLR